MGFKHQIPSTNNQIMTNIPMTEIPRKSKSIGYWSLVIGYYLVPPRRDWNLMIGI
jgi:hypothetical protein